MLIDQLLPDSIANQLRSVTLDAPAAEVYRAARSIDLMAVTSPSVRFLNWLRAFPDWISRKLGRAQQEPVLEHLTLDNLSDIHWLLLAETPGKEVVFGAVGKFYRPVIEWRDIASRQEFEAFNDPGFCKLACSFHVASSGDGTTVLRYEARTAATDRAATRRFRLYWFFIAPFAGHLMSAALKTVRRQLESSP